MRRAAGAIALVIASPALAQEQAPPLRGQEIVVTGRGLDAPPGEDAYAVTTIDRARIAGTASGRIEDVLRDTAGIAAFRRSDSRSAHPTSQGITLRGLGGNAASRALLLLDGVPQADPFGGWVAFPAYLPDRLAAIRVTRGGGSGYAGPGALAGTIALMSGSPAELGRLQARAAYGSRDSIDAALVGGTELGSGFVTLAGQYARGDGFAPILAGQRGPVDRAAPYRQASVALRGVADLGDAELQTNLSGFTDRRDRGVDFTTVRSDGVDASLRLVGRGRWGWSALAYLQTRQFASGFASVSDDRSSVSPALDQYRVPATGMGARIELAPPVGEGATLRLGADLRRVSGRTQERYSFVNGAPTRRRVAGGTSTTFGGFADAGLEAGALTLSAGGRIDRWEIADGSLAERALAGGPALTDRRFSRPDGLGSIGSHRRGAGARIGRGAAAGGLSRLAAADAQRALPPVPRRRRCHRRQCRACP